VCDELATARSSKQLLGDIKAVAAEMLAAVSAVALPIVLSEAHLSSLAETHFGDSRQ
jgi:hypothetical protein